MFSILKEPEVDRMFAKKMEMCCRMCIKFKISLKQFLGQE